MQVPFVAMAMAALSRCSTLSPDAPQAQYKSKLLESQSASLCTKLYER